MKWIEKIKNAEKEQDRDEWKKKADEAMEKVSGKQWDSADVDVFDGTVYDVDLLSSSLELMTSAIFSTDPRVIVFPRESKWKNAKDVELLLNYWYREVGMKSLIKMWVSTSLIMGRGILKIGIDDDDNIWVEPVDPRDFIIDPDSWKPDLSDADWVAERKQLLLKEIVEDDDLYPPENKAGLVNAVMGGQGPATAEAREALLREKIDCWEIYDRIAGKMYLFAEDKDDVPLIEEEYDFDTLESFPYVTLVMKPRPFTLYPQSEIMSLSRQQDALNKIYTLVIDAAMRAKTIIACDAAEDEQNQLRLAAARHGEVVGLNNLANVKEIAVRTLTAEQQAALSKIYEMMNAQLGLSEYLRGGAPSEVNTAIESMIISAGDQLRLGEKREILEVALRNVARYMFKLISLYMSKSKVIAIDKNATRWKKISKNKVKGEYDFQIEHGFASPLDRRMELQKLLAVQEHLMPYQQAGIVKIKALLDEVIKAIGYDPEEFLVSEEVMSKEAALEQENMQLKQQLQALMQQMGQLDESFQKGEIQIAQGEDRTAVPIDELRQEIEQKVASLSGQEEV